MPLAEFISTAHDSYSISSYLYAIKLELERTMTKRCFKVAPIICTDFSYALMNSVCNVFNNCKIEFYFDWCFEVLFIKSKSILVGHCMSVLLHLCGAHFLKIITQRVKKILKYKESKNSHSEESSINITKNKNLQKSFIFAFTLLQSASLLDDFIENFIHIHNIYNKMTFSKETENSCCNIKNKLKSREFVIISLTKETIQSFEPDFKFQNVGDQYHQYAKFNNNDKNEEKSLQKRSKFVKYFNLLESQLVVRSHENSSINTPNTFYCPEMFEIIIEYLFAIPLWSQLMLGRWQKLNTKYKVEDVTNLTNNPVENWFDQVKNDLLQGKTTMPSIHAAKLHVKVEAEFYTHYKNENLSLNKSFSSLQFQKEKWKLKKRYFKHKKSSYFRGSGMNNLFPNNHNTKNSKINGTVFSDSESQLKIS
jgi:hypothetical protein